MSDERKRDLWMHAEHTTEDGKKIEAKLELFMAGEPTFELSLVVDGELRDRKFEVVTPAEWDALARLIADRGD